MNSTEVKAQPAATSLKMEFAPVVTSVASAIACLAFFRPWTVFWLNLGGSNSGASGPLSFSGAALARQFAGTAPSLSWLLLTQAFLLIILLASFVRMFSTSFTFRSGYAVIVVALAIPVILWPAQAMGNLTRRLSHLSNRGTVKLELGVWWWIYAGVLMVSIVCAIVDFVMAVRLRRLEPAAEPGEASGA